MPEYYTEPLKISTYNSMEQIIFRINDLWARFNSLILKGKLTEANWVLDRLWAEFVADSNEEHKTKFKELKKEFAKINQLKERPKIYAFLMKKEEFLRILQDKQGKGVKHQESALDYMDG